MNFSETLLQFRAKHNLTQEQAANIIGIAHNTVHRLECEKNKPRKKDKIIYETKMKEWSEKNEV